MNRATNKEIEICLRRLPELPHGKFEVTKTINGNKLELHLNGGGVVDLSKSMTKSQLRDALDVVTRILDEINHK
jgi:hypothetical protein